MSCSLLRRLLLVAGLFTFVGCVTPMAPSEIDSLTTCKNVPLEKIKKNLLLAGYGIEHATDSEIITDFKQGGGRRWQRVTVIKMEDDLSKFKIRIRNESQESAPGGSSQTTVVSGSGKKAKKQTYTTTENRTERVTNDVDQSYYQEYRAEYERTRAEVCGS